MEKKLRIGINGFGRIGRAIFRKNKENDSFTIPIINEINPDNNISTKVKINTKP